MDNWVVGMLLVLAAGAIQGSFMLPIKYTTRWSWENTWLAFSVIGYLILPWFVALLTVPQLKAILTETSGSTFLRTSLFGFGWGLGCLTFGLGIDYLGLALGFAIILGLTASIGTLVPFLLLSPVKLASTQGELIIAGVVSLLVGISVCSYAGKLKDVSLRAGQVQPDRPLQKSYTLGLVFCVLSGIFSPFANLGFAFATEMTSLATKWGTPKQFAAIPFWAVMILPLFVCNGLFCVYLLSRNRSWTKFRSSNTGHYYFLAGAMAAMWFIGMLLYGFGATSMGRLGPSIGWAILMSSVVIMANLWGLITGEWRGTGRAPVRVMSIGVLILVGAIFVMGLGNG
jgi:L-rhamnose-H+ transport protein